MPDHSSIILLAEGDAETTDSWSGSSLSLVKALRNRSVEVTTCDCDLYGINKYLAAALTFSPDRPKWWVRYHLGYPGFRARSQSASSHLKNLSKIAFDSKILQIGATFSIPEKYRERMSVFSDGNIVLSEMAADKGVSCDAAFLSKKERKEIFKREKDVYSSAASIICISNRVKQSFVEDFGISPEKVHVAYIGANIGTIPSEIPHTKEPSILFVGRQFERKGGDLLLESFASVRKRIPNAKLTIIGVPPFNSVPDGVEMLGLLDKRNASERKVLEDSYLNSSVFCVPSKYEGLSVAFLEAMLYQLPCVGLRFGWLEPEQIVNRETGIIVDGDDKNALSDALVELLSSPTICRKMGQSGRERVQSTFTWEKVADRVVSAMR